MDPPCDEESLKKKLIKNKTQIKNISLELARLKAQSISCLNKHKLVVGSDTVIKFEDGVLSKAKNLNEAKKQILKISGKTNNIFSSVSVFYNNSEVWKKTQNTHVKMRKISEEEVDTYLSIVGKKILSSVGCFQVELMGPNIVEDINGDFFNVMGFPLFPFLKFIKEYKIKNKNK